MRLKPCGLASGLEPTSCLKKRSEEHTSELQSLRHLVCRLLLGIKNDKLKPQQLHPLLQRRTLARNLVTVLLRFHVVRAGATDPRASRAVALPEHARSSGRCSCL